MQAFFILKIYVWNCHFGCWLMFKKMKGQNPTFKKILKEQFHFGKKIIFPIPIRHRVIINPRVKVRKVFGLDWMKP